MPHATATKIPQPRLDLQILRGEIDRIDARLLELMEERLTCSDAIAAAKGDAEADQLRLRPAREALVIGRVAARHVTSDTALLVLGDGALRRRAEAGEKVQTLAICGNLRLCVSRSAAAPEAVR